MYVAFYKGRACWLDKIICWATRSPYSHVEIIDRRPKDGENPIGFTSSPRDGGVVVREIRWTPAHWDIVYIPWTDGKDEMAYVRARIGMKYDWLAILLTHILAIGRQDSGRYICSEIIGLSLGLKRAWKMSPGDLHETLTYAIKRYG